MTAKEGGQKDVKPEPQSDPECIRNGTVLGSTETRNQLRALCFQSKRVPKGPLSAPKWVPKDHEITIGGILE